MATKLVLTITIRHGVISGRNTECTTIYYWSFAIYNNSDTTGNHMPTYSVSLPLLMDFD